MLERARVGIDIGRVLMAATAEGGLADTSFLRGRDVDALETPPSDGAFRAVADIVTRTGGQVWLVSKAGPRVQELTTRWLAQWKIFETTGLDEEHVRFCLHREDKAAHAAELGLTHFIDDRLDVLQHLRGTVRRLYLFGHQRRGREAFARQRWFTPVTDWNDVRTALGL